MKLTFMDLCSGHGGTAEGFINAGFTGVGAFDINEHKLRFHKLNHPDTPIYKTNLLEINPGWIVRKIGKVNVLIITASCQGISRNGKFDFTHPLNVLLLRCIMMIPIISADAVVIENVDGLTVGEMKRLYNLVLRLLRGMKEYKLCDGILSAENYGTGQQRRRWICVLIKREIGIPSLPPPDTAGAELLRIKHIAPTLKFIKGGYHDENGIYHKIIRGINEWCFTITATPNAFNEDDELLSIPQVRKFCGYRDNYIYDEDHMRLAWKCFGDSVMPPMAFSIAMHIKKLLGESNDVSAARNFPIDGQIKLLCESNDVSAVGNLPTHAESIAPSISVREIIPVPVVTGMQKDITLLGDCLEVMPQLPDHSFDMIITDLPYGVTDHGWDKIIPPKLLWEQYKRLIKPDGAIVLFAQQPFTTDLINTNRRMFRYSMVWQKNRATGHLNAKRQPLRNHEEILVFYKKFPFYDPQKTAVAKGSGYEPTDRYPLTVMSFPKDHPQLHPTQKPLALVQKLIETYTRPGEIVLDSCAGCGTTGLAAKNTGRHYVQIERDPSYFEVAKQRTGEGDISAFTPPLPNIGANVTFL